MTTKETPAPAAFDEQRVLDELERLHRQILDARAARERAQAQFDAFTETFHGDRKPSSSPQTASPVQPPAVESKIEPPASGLATAAVPAVSTPVRAVPMSTPAVLPTPAAMTPAPSPAVAKAPVLSESSIPPRPQARPPEPPPQLAPPRPESGTAEPAPYRSPAATPQPAAAPIEPLIPPPVRQSTPSPRRSRVALAVIGALVVLAAMMFVWRGRQAPAVAETPSSQPAAAVAPVSPPVAPATTEAAPPATGVNLELTTRRRVWVRVTIDGTRAIERELAADQHIPLHGARLIVIRAGDAGALLVTRDGGPAGPLGPDGAIASREFSLTPR